MMVTLIATLGAAAPAGAGVIERACLKSQRAGANGTVCGCIQSVADQTLTRADQRQAARFFKNPDKAQEMRQSDRSGHEVFWKRYKAFGENAEAMCS